MISQYKHTKHKDNKKKKESSKQKTSKSLTASASRTKKKEQRTRCTAKHKTNAGAVSLAKKKTTTKKEEEHGTKENTTTLLTDRDGKTILMHGAPQSECRYCSFLFLKAKANQVDASTPPKVKRPRQRCSICQVNLCSDHWDLFHEKCKRFVNLYR